MTDNDFDTQRTELANRFASAGAEFLGQMPLAAAALAEVPNTQPQQYAMVGEPKAIRALLPSGDMPARRMRHGQRPTEPLEWEPSAIANKATEEGEPELSMAQVEKIRASIKPGDGWDGDCWDLALANATHAHVRAADRASRQVANKAEVEPDTQAHAIFPPKFPEFQYDGLEGSMLPPDLWDYACLVGYRCATPPARVGASTVLTDERIEELFTSLMSRLPSHPALLDFARAIEREVAAQAGQVAVPEGWAAQIKAAMKESQVGHNYDGNKLAWKLEELLAAAPAAPAQAKPLPSGTIDTREFRELLAKSMDAAELATRTGEPHRDYKPARDALVAHIDARLGAQASTAGGRQEGGNCG